MREIKFRSWHKLLEVMSDDIDSINIREYEKQDQLILMQFTGLKDKNGGDIYEGDIVDSLPNTEQYYPNRQIVEYHALAFMYIGKTKNASPHCEYTLGTITSKNIAIDKRIEVVGNIYENPELLEKEKK